MFKTIFVGNLPLSASEDDVRNLFSQQGDVRSVKLIMDSETGKPCGYGFITMKHNAANSAIETLNGKNFSGRRLQVKEAGRRGSRQSRRY